jgi:hypothetical protein
LKDQACKSVNDYLNSTFQSDPPASLLEARAFCH